MARPKSVSTNVEYGPDPEFAYIHMYAPGNSHVAHLFPIRIDNKTLQATAKDGSKIEVTVVDRHCCHTNIRLKSGECLDATVRIEH